MPSKPPNGEDANPKTSPIKVVVATVAIILAFTTVPILYIVADAKQKDEYVRTHPQAAAYLDCVGALGKSADKFCDSESRKTVR